MHLHSSTIRRLHSTARRRRASVIVEVAFLLPVLLMLATGIVEFGRAISVSRLLSEAACHGARLANVDGSTNADVEAAIESLLLKSIGVAAENVTVTISVTPPQEHAVPGNDLVGAQAHLRRCVRVEVPFDMVSYFPASYLPGKTLKSSSDRSHELCLQ